MTVSVISPCYNAAAYVGETLASVQAQGVDGVEVVAVDDGSTDGTWAILEAHGERVRRLRTEHRGGCHARNAGAAAATGEALMFLDADDVLGPGALPALSAALAGQALAVAACPWKFLRQRGDCWIEEPPELPLAPPGGDPLAAWLRGWFVPTNAVLWTRQAFEATGGWDETVTANQDGDIMMRAFAGGTSLRLAQGGVSFYRRPDRREGSVSGSVSEYALQSRARVIGRVRDTLAGPGRLQRYHEPLGIAWYILARLCERGGADELRQQCLREAARHLRRGRLTDRVLLGLGGIEAAIGVRRLTRRVRRAWRPGE